MRALAVTAIPAVDWARHERPVRHGLILAGLVFAAGTVASMLATGQSDIHSYWIASPAHAYGGYVLGGEGQAYTPVWTMGFGPLTALPFPLVYAAWLALNFATVVWLLRPLPLRWVVPGIAIVSPELLNGNVHLLIAASLVLGLTGRGGAWAFPLLTKVTPGLGIVWHLVRGERRGLSFAVATTGALVAVSLLLAPGLWVSWWLAMTRNAWTHGPELLWVPLWPRLPLAFAAAVYAARTDRAWLVPVAVLLALPHIDLQGFAVLAAVPRLRNEHRQSAQPSYARRLHLPYSAARAWASQASASAGR